MNLKLYIYEPAHVCIVKQRRLWQACTMHRCLLEAFTISFTGPYHILFPEYCHENSLLFAALVDTRSVLPVVQSMKRFASLYS